MSCSTECTPDGYAFQSPQRVIRFNDFVATVAFFAAPNGECDKVPLNMSGYSEFDAIIFVREPSKALASMEVVTERKAEGVLTFKLANDSEFFDKYPAATYRWQFSMRSAEGQYKTYIRGTFEVLPNG
jgi:hypothetical protein